MGEEGREILRAAKAAASRPPPALCVPVGTPAAAWLRPVVTRPGAIAPEDVSAITEWRNRFRGSFLTEFTATESRTERWLAEAVGTDDSRIFFMVDDPGGATVGHMALAVTDWRAGIAEVDSVVRGGEAPKGLATRALHGMWQWGRAALGLSDLHVRVRSDNTALEFYEKAGFRELRRVPLRRHEAEGEVQWVKEPSLNGSNVSLVHMELVEGPDG